ncbi:MAG: tRNA pseudouridine(38-40) synthase TruA [Gemmataceae bacterium]|nr:tRNA pseudouridine(38-40) synthase TruA [Gemmataceae bacterium]
MRNIKITLSYEGTNFFGWQTQPGKRTVQETTQEALAKLLGHEINLRASSRTDAGVHALGQVANFRTPNPLPIEKILSGTNAFLPEEIAIRQAEEVSVDFDANRDARRKLYRYSLYQSRIPDPFSRSHTYQVRQELNLEEMKAAATVLLGTHDFRCFETDWPNRESSVRTMNHVSLSRMGPWIWLDIEGDGFLYNMVRAIMGTLLEIGRGFWPRERMREIVDGQDRKLAGPTVPPHGLYLVRVTY